MRTEYEYPLPDGSPNRKVVRIDKSDGGKDIYQLSWNDQKFVPGNAHGEATWFNAPLLESMSQDGIDCLCIGEGEKVAQRGNGIVGVGMVFTTMAGGANAKMTENMKGLLQRWNPNRIRLYADRDQAGDEWANYMHTELTAMGMTVDGIWFPHPISPFSP